MSYGILGFLRLLHERFKFTAFDTLLTKGAENDPDYGLSNVLSADLFALLYTAVYSMCLCDNYGMIITKESFIPLLKNSSLFLFRYFKTLCTRELARFSVRGIVRGSTSNSMTLSSARKLKNYFTLLNSSYLFLTKPLGHPVDMPLDFGEDFGSSQQVEETVHETSNFARRMQTNQRLMASTPSSTTISVEAPSISSLGQRSASPILDEIEQSEYDVNIHVPHVLAKKRDRATAGVVAAVSSPNTRRQKAAVVAAPVSKPPPSCSLDKYLRYLPNSTLGPHAGGGIIHTYTYFYYTL